MKELTGIIPNDLEEVFSSLDYEEDGGLTIRSFRYLNKDLHVDFLLYLGDAHKNETQNWRLEVLGYRDSKIDIDNLGGYFNFYSEHYLLSEYIDNHTQLYFKKSVANQYLLMSEIYNLHKVGFENYIPIEKYLNSKSLTTLCGWDYGLFASGPEGILKHYFECLEKVGAEPYFYGESIPKKWDGEKWIPEDNDLKVALLGGTYFIGQDFKFKRID